MRKALFIVAFLLMCSPAFAYQEFSNNSGISDASMHGLVFLHTGVSTNYASYSSNCGGYGGSGCVALTNGDAYPNSFMYVFTMDKPSSITGSAPYLSKNVTAYGANDGIFNETYFTVPADKEVILVTRWIDEPTGYSLAPPNGGSDWGGMSLFCNEDGIHTIAWPNASFAGNGVGYGTWYDRSLIVPASNITRHCQAHLKFGMQASPQTVYVDYFKVYTYDITEARNPATFMQNLTAEQVRYCGAGANGEFIVGTDNPIAYYNSTTEQGYFISAVGSVDASILGVDSGMVNTFCLASILNNSVTVRRVSNITSNINIGIFGNGDPSSFVNWFYGGYAGNGEYTYQTNTCTNQTWYILAKTTDPYFYLLNMKFACDNEGIGVCLNGTFTPALARINSLQLNSMQVTTYQSGIISVLEPFGNCPNGTQVFQMDGNLTYDGIPVNYVSLSFLNQALYGQSVNLVPYSRFGFPAGSNWNYKLTPNQSYSLGDLYFAGTNNSYPFFFTPLTQAPCASGYVCDNNTDYQQYQTFINNQCVLINPVYCGVVGCNATSNRCNVAPVCSNAWVCNGLESWHYDVNCNNDLRLLCQNGCNNATGQCSGEINCVSNSDCQPYCSGSDAFFGGTCNLTSYDCNYNSQPCSYGCNNGACSAFAGSNATLFGNQPQTPLNAVSTITGAVLGFLNLTGVPLFTLVFWIFAIMIIISIFALIAHAIKSGFG